ncbi:bifunctional adenosylcobinamide kinase/adenosylcobinamide-phosphate guanylyltransferase, partial [Paenibacillus popilliae]
EPLQLPEWLARTRADAEAADEVPAVLIDCLTLWLSNELLRAEQQWGAGLEAERYLEARIERLEEEAVRFHGTLVMVTNEVGDSIVPVYKLGRVFRDAAGRLNQRIAGKVDEVYLVTAGIPIELKSREVQL